MYNSLISVVVVVCIKNVTVVVVCIKLVAVEKMKCFKSAT